MDQNIVSKLCYSNTEMNRGKCLPQNFDIPIKSQGNKTRLDYCIIFDSSGVPVYGYLVLAKSSKTLRQNNVYPSEWKKKRRLANSKFTSFEALFMLKNIQNDHKITIIWEFHQTNSTNIKPKSLSNRVE